MGTSALTRRHQEIRRWRESYAREGRLEEFVEGLNKVFADPSTNLGEYRVRLLFEALVDDGHELVQNHFGPNSGGGFILREAADSINTGLFATVQGQYLYNAVLRAYQNPQLIGDRLVNTMNSIEVSERIPGITAIGDQVEVVHEGEPYQKVLATERFVDTPDTIKRGLTCDVTMEAVFFDKTNLILQEAANIGKYIGINRERRILDVVLGLSTVYRRNGAAATATYDSTNTSTSNGLVDYTSIDSAHVKMQGITDPDNGEPIVGNGECLICTPARYMAASRILNAVMTNYNTNQSAGTASVETRVGGSSIRNPFRIESNQYVKERLAADGTWFYGDPKMAFVYMQNWPLKVESQGGDGPEAFDRDVVARYKASERGAAGVIERLYNLKCTE